jgi:hypothetical protein
VSQKPVSKIASEDICKILFAYTYFGPIYCFYRFLWSYISFFLFVCWNFSVSEEVYLCKL